VGKHEVGFTRIERDFYPTPSWVIEALAEHVDLAGMCIWECACGDGRMAEALRATGASVYASDIEDRGYAEFSAVLDFVAGQIPKTEHFDAIITNPPFGSRGKLAEQFIRTGLRRITDCPFMALLLPVDFDSAKTRMPLLAALRSSPARSS
jgi:tRNA G10  N-methylase Trm11